MVPRSIAKSALLAVARGTVAPLVVAYRLERALWPEARRHQLFQAYSQALAMLPGLSGQFVRRAFYGAVLAECHPDSCIQWGTIFSTEEARVARGVYIGARCTLGHVVLEEDATLGSNVDIPSGRNQHGIDDPDLRVQDQPGRYETVRIGRNTWVGNGAVVLADVGARSVVAAGSVVTAPIPDDVIAGGNPARVLRRRDPETKRWTKVS
jgi:acetyltransferase-like isoleucine patch superfamily enzyme